MPVTLVAGGAGFLGSAVARRLAAEQERVLVADYFNESGDGRAVKEARARELLDVKNVEVLRTDLSSPMMVEALIRRHRPSAVVNATLFDPRGPGLEPLVKACLASGVGYFLHLSDAALYPDPPDPVDRRVREDEPPDAGDDDTLIQRYLEEAFLEGSGLRHSILRVFPVLGSRLAERRFPMLELQTLLRDETVLLSDDEPRDFLHVEDAARAVQMALQRKPTSEILNVGSGVAARPSEVLQELALHAGLPVPVSFPVAAPASARRPRVADVAKSQAHLGFTAERGIGDAVAEIAALLLPGEPASTPPPEGRSEAAAVSRRELFGFFRTVSGREAARG